jgi:type I restriction enzyme S subunit
MRYVGLEHIEPQTMKLIQHGHGSDARSSSVRFSKGDVLYGKMRPYLNKVWVAEFDGICSAEFLVFAKQEGLNNQFLALRLNTEGFVGFANEQISGERPRVDFEKLARFPILMPPLREQERIVAKLDTALSGLERAQKAARRAHERLPLYRDAVLRAAVTGKLTREWRQAQDKKPSSQRDNGNVLLRRLLAVRRGRWEETARTHLREKGKDPKSEGKSLYKEPALPDTANLPELPTEWIWGSLDMIAEIGSGISVSQNRLVKNPVELPYLRVANVMRGYLDLTEVKTIRVEEERADQYLLEVGDILFTEGGDRDKLGRGWIWEGQIPKCVHQNHIFRARLNDPSVLDARLVSHWANSFGQRFFLAHGTQTTNLASINRTVLSKLPVPIPPLAEQSQIIFEVGRRLEAATQLAARLDQQFKRERSTREALLREAFTGRLVSSNPNDEPASVLLKRIRAQKAQREVEWKEARQLSRTTLKKRSKHMQEQLLSPESLRAAWNRIGEKADARQLFDEAGLGPEHVVQFYEALRATPDVRAAFQKASQEGRRPQRLTKATNEAVGQPQGRFRLIDLWLEDFKNLKDYTVRFDPAHGLDVVLGWNGTGKSNLFEALVIIFRDLHNWWEKNRWPEKPMNGFQLSYEVDERTVEVNWRPGSMKRPELKSGPISSNGKDETKLERIKREQLPLPHFVFGYYSGPTNRLAEHFLPMKQAHYDRLREAKADDAKTLAKLLEQRRFFCADTTPNTFCWRFPTKMILRSVNS